MEPLACLNGVFQPASEARVPIWDRGFLFGDAVYEVLRMYQGRCWLEDDHYLRLERSLAAIEIDAVDIDRLRSRVRQTIERSGIQEGLAYLHLTRGVAVRKHAFPAPDVEPTELIVIMPYDDTHASHLRETGIELYSAPDLRWKRCDIKSTNLLANVLALQSSVRQGGFESVLVDSSGWVTEATHSSILWCRDGGLYGTPETRAILPGMTRKLILQLADLLEIRFTEAQIQLDELFECDEVLISGTSVEVMPVIEIDGQKVGDGVRGPIAQRLQAEYRTALDRWLGAAVSGVSS